MEDKEFDLKKENTHKFAQRMSNNLGDINKMITGTHGYRLLDRSQLLKALQDPHKNSETLQKYSFIMNYNSGILKELLIYKSNILTYDHYILPLDMSKYKSQDKLEKAELDAALQLEKYNIKFNFPWMTKNLISNGELYIYKIENKDCNVIQEMPRGFCKAVGSKNAIMKYAINLGKISDKTKDQFPIEIQMLHDDFKNGRLKGDENLIDNNFYYLDKNAYCFNLEYMAEKGSPYYAHLFNDLMILEEMKDIESETAKIDNFKLIIQKALTDEDGALLMDEEDVALFHQALKNEVPEGVGVVTTPMPIDNVNLADSKQKKLDYNNKIKDGIYDSSGVNSEIFNGNKSSNEAVALGSIVDTLLPLNILESFKVWLNMDFKENSKTKNWMINFIDSTKYNKDNKIKMAKDTVATYSGKKQYLATLGMTPLEAINTLKYEELSGIGEKMLPLMTAHTMSGDAGRPSNSDTDSNLNTGQSDN